MTTWRVVQSDCQENKIPEWLGTLPQADSIQSPLQYFSYFFDDDLFEHIVEQSNLFAIQKDVEKPLCLTKKELEQFIGTLIYTTVFTMPRTRMYWAGSSRVSQIADIFSRTRWEIIKQNLHFNDNTRMLPADDETRDKLFKIRPLIDKLLGKFKAIPLNQMLSVDEQIVPFKGHSGLKQYNPNKPHKWGYKIFILCDSHGLVHNFEIYTGKIYPSREMPDIGPSGNIVLKLAEVIPRDKNHVLFFDNWFTSLKLLCTLHSQGIHSTGTIRSNRMGSCRLIDDKQLKIRGRGSYEEREGTVAGVSIRILKWFDNRAVTLASTFASSAPISTVSRWDKSLKKHIDVPFPNTVALYNKFMGGVDLLDGLVAYHRTKIRSKKFYHRLFFHLLDMICVNSWLLYRRDATSLGLPKKRQIDLLEFKSSIAQGLCLKGKMEKKRGRSSLSSVESSFVAKRKRGPTKAIPIKDVRTDGLGHWPEVTGRQRCKNPKCSSKSNIICTKCKIHLCLNKHNNCFREFHQ